jgi:hypothetical protein
MIVCLVYIYLSVVEALSCSKPLNCSGTTTAILLAAHHRLTMLKSEKFPLLPTSPAVFFCVFPNPLF